MVYEGRSAARRGAARGNGRREKRRSGGSALLTLCIWALFLAVAVRIVFPEFAESAAEKARMVFTGKVDYAQAVRILGEAMDNGSGLVEAAGKAWEYAFAPQGGDVQVSGEGPVDGAEPASGDTEGEQYLPTIAPDEPIGEDDEPAAEMPQNGDETAPEADPDSSKTDADAANGSNNPADLMAAFIEGQSKYKDLGIPRNVTYDMPELPLELVRPVEGEDATGFGWGETAEGKTRFHYGLDLGSGGAQVRAAAGGTVSALGDSTTYGKYVILRHEGGVESLYAHMTEVSVENGQEVASGEALGVLGDDPAYLHMELLVNGEYVNPAYYLG